MHRYEIYANAVLRNSVNSMSFISMASVNNLLLIIDTLHISKQMLQNSLEDAFQSVSDLQCQWHLLVNLKEFVVINVDGQL
jgi:hypothetical protein